LEAPEEEEEEEEVEDVAASTGPAFVPTFNFNVVPIRESANKPVELASGGEDPSERTAPQIS
jgi:hypothetical protein